MPRNANAKGIFGRYALPHMRIMRRLEREYDLLVDTDGNCSGVDVDVIDAFDSAVTAAAAAWHTARSSKYGVAVNARTAEMLGILPSTQQPNMYPLSRSDTLKIIQKCTGLSLSECHDCDSCVPVKWLVASADARLVCPSCLADSYVFNPRTGGFTLVETPMNFSSDDILGYNANPMDYALGFRVSPFDIKAVPQFGEKHPPYAGVPYMGVELEVECRAARKEQAARDCARMLRDTAIIKADGSLRNGFEICSVPGTLSWHKYGNDGKMSPWAEMLGRSEQLALLGDTTTTAGLHVHISRSAMTPLIAGKMHKFINDTNNRGFLSDVAGRPMGNSYAQTDNIPISRVHRGGGDKYRAFNMQHRDTFEIRIFRSTVIFSVLMARLEFVDALRNFSVDASIGRLSWRDFVQFLHTDINKSMYPYLVKYLRDGELWKNKVITSSQARTDVYEKVLTRPTTVVVNPVGKAQRKRNRA